MAGREAKAWGPPSTQGPWHSPRAQSHDTLVKRTQRAPASPSARGPWVAVPRPAGGPWARLARLCSPLGAGMVHLTGGLREKGSRGQTPAVTETPGWGHSATGGVRVGLSVLWDPQLRAGGRGQVVCFLTETASRAGNQTQKEPDAQTDAEPCGGPLLSSLPVSAHPLTCSCSQELPVGHLSEPATPNSQKSSHMPLGWDTQHPSILGAHFPACRRSPNLPCPPEGLTPLLPEGSPSS